MKHNPAHDSTVYRGHRLTDARGQLHGVKVYRGDRELDPRPSWDLRNHSPTGFEWGYSGSGPAQLALALVYDVLGDVERALAVYQDFKRAVVAGWQDDHWRITAGDVRRSVEDLENVRPVIAEGGAA